MELRRGYPPHTTNPTCAHCGKGGIPNEQVIDLDIAIYDDSPNGDLFLCVDDGVQIAKLVGWLDPRMEVDYVRQITRLTESDKEWRARAERLQTAYMALIEALVSDPDLALQIALQARGKTMIATFPEPEPDDSHGAVAPVTTGKVGAVVPKSR